jgi:hypothetical protein
VFSLPVSLWLYSLWGSVRGSLISFQYGAGGGLFVGFLSIMAGYFIEFFQHEAGRWGSASVAYLSGVIIGGVSGGLWRAGLYVASWAGASLPLVSLCAGFHRLLKVGWQWSWLFSLLSRGVVRVSLVSCKWGVSRWYIKKPVLGTGWVCWLSWGLVVVWSIGARGFLVH